ncbi:RNA/RNP complex-1-interacting phosphatase isoform X2 [Gouania willdenowi]|nr:RNA/RNP complex-1-interacting phosphatase isoform X2 [Gouania willdenowi]
MSRHQSRGGIPDRWLDYSAVGKRLAGTRFIAFKVPLKQALSQQLSPDESFGFSELLENMKEQKQQLGLIIDLTFTHRYYSPQDFPDFLSWVKMKTAGHEVPSDRVILNFKRIVRRFIRENQDNDLLIGVHCTHGLNRTGYLICRYLIDVDHMNPNEALQLFESSRGHHIERDNYLRDLRTGPRRSNHGIEEGGAELRPRRGEQVEERHRDRLPASLPPDPAHLLQQPQWRAMPRDPLPQHRHWHPQHQNQYPQYVYQPPQHQDPAYVYQLPQHHNHYSQYAQQHHQNQYQQYQYRHPPSWSRLDRRSRHVRGSDRRESDGDGDGGRHRRGFNP